MIMMPTAEADHLCSSHGTQTSGTPQADSGGTTMAVDTFVAYVGVYDNAAGADADYETVKELHTKAGLIDAYDAAVIERRADGKVKITKKHETPTWVGGVLGGGAGLATGLVVALFPFAAIGGACLRSPPEAARCWARWPATQRPG
jgi:hypothetical protein